MPVFVRFNSGENLRLAENFDQVNRQLGEAGRTAGLFNTAADHPVRVVVFAANIEYIQELGEDEGQVARRPRARSRSRP